jgi:hypothetical protein
MRKRKLRRAVAGLTLAGLTLAVLLAVGAFLLWLRPVRGTRENCDRVREGMSSAEVYAILGPAGDSRTALTEEPLHSDDFDFDPALVESVSHVVYINVPAPKKVEKIVW